MQNLITQYVRVYTSPGSPTGELHIQRVDFNETHALEAHTDIFSPRFPGDACGIPRQAAMELVNKWNAGQARRNDLRWFYYIEQ